MTFDPTLAAIRFGTGLGPRYRAPADLDAVLDDLTAEDRMARRFRIPGIADAEPSYASLYWLNRAARRARDTDAADAAQQARRAIRVGIGTSLRRDHLATIARAVEARFGIQERLTAFWADHFTVRRRGADTIHLVSPFVEDAIRPHITGSFPAMLRAVVTHPMMLFYLEQHRSVGPRSEVGKRQGRGLNENLARELLELHLLGVDGAYAQSDVRELAELLTGLSFNPYQGFIFNPELSEPGAERVLGLRFDRAASLDNILSALDTLALLPETAVHLARKLAVHFIAMDPPPDMIATMADAYLLSDGDLGAMTRAMLTHPDAFRPTKEKVRRPGEFITASLRALGMHGNDVADLGRRTYGALIYGPLQIMGQPWQRPPGPDGWPEDPAAWVIPQAMAGRISWAMRAPQRLMGALPDPRDFARHALADHATPDVLFAAGAAEKRSDGVGVVLASAAFQRR